jgi:hypothetical protein
MMFSPCHIDVFFQCSRRKRPLEAGTKTRQKLAQAFGKVTAICPWYFPPRSLYEVSHLVALEEQHLRAAFAPRKSWPAARGVRKLSAI